MARRAYLVAVSVRKDGVSGGVLSAFGPRLGLCLVVGGHVVELGPSTDEKSVRRGF